MTKQRPLAAFHLRSAGRSDLDACAAVVGAAAAADGVSQVETRDTLAHDLEHSGELGDAVVGVAEQDGEVIAFHRLGWFEQPDGLEVYTHRGHVLPSARGQGIGNALVTRAEQQLTAFASQRGTSNAKVLSAWFYKGEAGVSSLLEAWGYERHRTMLEMQHDLKDIPEHLLPPGLEVRPFQPEQLRTIWEAYVEFSADEVSSSVHTEKGFQAWQTLPRWEWKLSSVAWCGNSIAGLALTRRTNVLHDRYAYTEFVGTRRSKRRRGIAGALLSRNLRNMTHRGLRATYLDVATDNVGALLLYEGLGYWATRQLSVVRRAM